MLQNIPTHVIAGPLGAGKTTLIRHLMQQRPSAERWAVLINEFGQIGLDAALLTTGDDGIALGEVAGGCLCCVNGAPFQVGLARLLRKARPDRLFIEPSGLGHPLQLLRQLGEPPWQGVLAVQPLVMVLDATGMALGHHLPESQGLALAEAGLLLMNKSRLLDAAARLGTTTRWPELVSVDWRDADQLCLADLPVASVVESTPGQPAEIAVTPDRGMIWRNCDEPICQVNAQVEGWSIGWRWHPQIRFDHRAVQQWLAELAFQRAKLVIHSCAGWQSLNVVEDGPMHWQASEWRRDSRLELIFAEPQDQAALQARLASLRVA